MSARRPWAWPLVPLYATGLAVKDGLRAARVLRTRSLQRPVVSVGSLSAGGAGKTPVVIALAELLRGRGWSVDVISRGYRRKGSGVELVDRDASDAARRFGDEPVLLSRRLHVPVWVGAKRFAAGMAAERLAAEEREADSSATLQPSEQRPLAGDPGMRNDKRGALRNDAPRGVHLLDDGFQHRKLARAVDVVLVTATDLEDALLPAGNRRERLAALRRADVVVVREEERERIQQQVRGLMRLARPMWSVERELRFPDGLTAGPKPLAFCAIARPDGFSAMLAEARCAVVETVVFRNHHEYRASDVERLVRIAKENGATGFVTTEKDAVKLSQAMLARLQEIGPACVVELVARFLDEAGVVRELEARIR